MDPARYNKLCADAAMELFTEVLLRNQDLNGKGMVVAGTDLQPMINALRLCAAVEGYWHGLNHGVALTRQIKTEGNLEAILEEVKASLERVKQERGKEVL